MVLDVDSATAFLLDRGMIDVASILDGELTVDYGKHGKRTYRKGQTFMEAMNTSHVGINTGSEPLRLLAVYMGAKHAKDVIPVR